MKIIKILPLLWLFALLLIGESFGQNPAKVLIPATPTYSYFDTSCFIPCGTLSLGQGKVANLFTSQGPVNTYIPKNRYTWALSIAHAWNYTRNVLKTPTKLDMELWLAIANQETQMGCIPNTIWNTGEGSLTQGGASGIYGQDGCFQMENSGTWGSFAGEVRQIYPVRFVNPEPRFYFNYSFERASISMAYEFIMKIQRSRYKYGVDPYAIAVGACDPLAFDKVLASYHNAQMWSFRDGQTKYLFTNSAALQTNCNWPNFGVLGDVDYVTKAGKQLAALKNLTSHGDYQAGSTYSGTFNPDIRWDTVATYLNIIKPFYSELSAATWTALVTKVQAKFVSISGSVATPIKFANLGPVIDEIIINLPKEDPTVPSLTNDGTNANWTGVHEGWGDLVPTGKLVIDNSSVCLGASYDLTAFVEGGDNPSNTFKFYRNGSLIYSGTNRIYVETPTAAGTYTYRVEMCNSKGCLQAGCDKKVVVTNCNTCGMTVTATATNTPCQNMKAGSITLTIGGATDYTVNYTGPVSGSLTGSGANFTISNLPDGFYNIEVIKQGAPTCKAIVSKTVQFTTAQNASLDAKITNTPTAPTCIANLQADIVANPVPCLWKVKFHTSPSYYYFPAVFVLIKPGSNNPGSYQTNMKDPVNTWMNVGEATFYASTGENIDIDLTVVPTPGASLLEKMDFEIINPLGTVVWTGTAPAGAVSEAGNINYHLTTYTVTCPPPPALSYTFSWNPSITVTSSTAMQSKGNAGVTSSDVVYTVTATMGGCSLTDQVLVAGNAACVPTCTAPTTTPSFVSTSVSACSPATGADVTATLPNGVYYQLFNSSTNAAIGSPAGPTASAGNVTFTNVAAGSYHVRIANTAANLTAATCYKVSAIPVTITINATPTVTATNPAICSGATTSIALGGATSYTWTAPAYTGTVTGGSASSGTTISQTLTGSGTAVYSVTGTTGTCNSAVKTVTVTVNANPVVTATDPTICSGSTTSIALTGATSYSWTLPVYTGTVTGGSAGSGTSISQTLNGTGTAVYSVTGTTGACNSAVKTITVTVTANPVVTATNPTICSGATTSIALGGATSYSWTAPAYTGTVTGGSASSGTTISQTLSGAGTAVYSVTGTTGTCNSAVKTVTVTVNANPVVTATNPTICSGATTSIALGGATSYTWTAPTYTGTVTGGSASTGTSISQTLTGAGTAVYSVTGTTGTCNSAVKTVTVTVTANPVVTATDPTICSGATTSIALTGATSYTWTAPAYTGTVTGGSGGSGTSISQALSGAGTAVYSITGTSGTCNSAVKTVTVTVTANPVVTAINPTICSGATTSIALTGATSYTWTAPAYTGTVTGGSAGTGTSISQTLSGAGTAVYSVTGTSGTCNSAVKTVTVTVTANPVVTATNPTICSGATTSIALGGATSYTWTAPSYTGTVTGGSASSGTTISQTLTGSGTAVYSVTGTSGTCNSAVKTVTVTVTANPVLIATDPTICSGATTSIALTGATSYTWTAPAYTGTVTGGSAGSGTTISQTLTGAGTAVYSVTGTTGTCNSTVKTITVTVGASLAVTASNPTICSGATTNIVLGGATSYTWAAPTYTGTVTGGSASTGTIISQTLTGTGTAVYSVTGTTGTCSSPVKTITVTVTANPVVTASNPTICSGATTSIVLGGATSYSWTAPTYTGTVTGGSAGTGSTIAQTLTGVGTAVYSVTGTTGTCNSVVKTVTVTVNANPVVTATDPTICTGTSTSIALGGATSYTWTVPIYTGTVTGGSAGSGTSISQTLNGTGTAVYSITGTTGTCNSAVKTVTVTVNATPTVTATNPTICSGTTTSITLTGATSYTWTAPTYTGTVTGGSASTGTTIAQTLTGSGTAVYSVTGATGTCNSAVKTITVTVTANPVVTASNPTICSGATTSIALGGATSYTWTAPAYTGTVTGGSAGGGTSISQALNGTGTAVYSITGTTGTCNSVVKTVTVTVNTTPTVTATDPTICAGTTTSIALTGATSYSWTAPTYTGTVTGGSASSGTTIAQTLSGAGTAVYSVTGTTGTCNSVVKTVTVTVNATPVVTAPDPTICSGAATSIALSGATSYIWPTPIYTGTVTGGAAGSGSTIAQTLTGAGTAVYSITGTIGTCNSAVKTITVTVASSLAVTATDPTVCTGTPTSIVLSGASSYSWPAPTYTGTVTGGSASSGTTIAQTLSGVGTAVYSVTGTSGTCNSAVKTITVTINANPVVTATDATICAGTATGVVLSGATSYSWTVPTYTGTVTGGSASSGSIIAQTLDGAGTAVYSVTGTTGTCNSVVKTITVTVNANPVVTATDPTVCTGTPTSIVLSGASSYSWPAPTYTGTVTGGSASSGTTIAQTLSGAGTAVYSVTGTSGTCISAVKAITVTVNANPVVIATDPTICTGATTSIALSGATDYSWSAPTYTGTVTGGSASSGSTIAQTLSGSGTAVYSVTGTTGTCNSVVKTITVTVDANPVVTAADATICAGTATGIALSGASSYSWSAPTYTGTVTGGSASSGSIIVQTLNGEGTAVYSVSGTTGTCNSVVKTITVTVTTNPIVTASNVAVCEGTATSIALSGATSYSWPTPTYTGTVSGGSAGSGLTIAQTLSGAGTAVYSVTGAIGTCNSTVKMITVTVNAAPNSSAVIIEDTTTCLGNSAIIKLTNTQSGTSYSGYIGGSSVGSAMTSSGGTIYYTIPSSELATGNKTVTFSAQTVGCTTPLNLLDDATVHVIGNSKPEIVSDPLQGDPTPCSTTGLQYSIKNPIPGANYYDWKINAGTGTINGNGSSTITLDISSSSVEISVTPRYYATGLGCTSSSLLSITPYSISTIGQLVTDDFDNIICQDQTVTFTLMNSSLTSIDFVGEIDKDSATTLSQTTTTKTIRFDKPGDYTIVAGYPCDKSKFVQHISVHPFPVAEAGKDTVLKSYAPIVLNGTGSSTGAYTYAWTSNDPGAAIQNAGALITAADFKMLVSQFTLKVTDTVVTSCTAEDSRTVALDVQVKDIPNVFSPNGDLHHDNFEIENLNRYSKSVVYIYNQWGELIFKSEPGYPKPWDGKRNGHECEIGAYFMVIEFNQDKIPAQKLTINLIR